MTERIACCAPRDSVADNSAHKQRWREIPGLADDESFRSRLAAEGISEQQFDCVTARTAEELCQRTQTPQWLVPFFDAYAVDDRSAAADVPAAQSASLLALIEPLVRRARARVQDAASRLGRGTPFDPNTVEPLLYAHMAGRLTQLISLATVLEMHVARLQGQLRGATPEQRFRNFVRTLGVPSVARRLFAEYPVLARLVVEALEQWAVTSIEFLGHLSRDSARLQMTFNGGASLGQLRHVETGAGDAHRGGRSVRLLHFTCGLRLAYKPRSLAVDCHFMRLLGWLNQRRGKLLAFRVLRVLDCTDHGWVEFVDHLPCRSEQELDRFYRRQGMNLALLHALGARDFHYENLIASGEQPVLIDLETLLAPGQFEPANQLALDQARNDVRRSVLGVGLLPYRAWSGRSSDGIDLSGLGSPSNQQTPLSVSVWQDAGTDAARRERRRVPLKESCNRPTLMGRRVSVAAHAKAILQGFAGMYRLLRRLHEDLLRADGPLAAFADDEVRVVLRPTVSYAVLLAEACHPDVLRDALARDRLFDRLWATTAQRPELARVFTSERADLWRGDIPYFATRPASCDLWNSRGEQLAGFFPVSGMDLVHARLGQFSAEDLTRQLWYISASLSSLATGDAHGAGAEKASARGSGGAATRDRLHAAARAVGERLAKLALRGEGEAAWNGLQFRADRHLVIAPLGLDLYDGLPGVTLFLAQLGAVTGEHRFSDLAMASLATQMRLLDHAGGPFAPIGAFTGVGGLIYMLTRLAALWDRTDLRQRAEALAEKLLALIEEDEQLDMLGGAAGCLACLLALHGHTPSDRTLEAARRCADHLLRTARRTTPGIGWAVPGMGERPLAGFSHGAAGIAWALLGLWDVTRDQRYRRVAQEAIDYERSLFCPDAGNWLDYRPRDAGESPDPKKCMTAWCHGAPGIGLARLGRLQQLDDARVRAEIEVAIETTVGHGRASNHSLCHGEMGNLELLLRARSVLCNDSLEQVLARRTAAVLESIEHTGPRCGVPRAVETPGLMTGLAGIGYGLLRLADPQQVPSVLLLET